MNKFKSWNTALNIKPQDNKDCGCAGTSKLSAPLRKDVFVLVDNGRAGFEFGLPSSVMIEAGRVLIKEPRRYYIYTVYAYPSDAYYDDVMVALATMIPICSDVDITTE